MTLIGILSKKLRKLNILIENLCKQVSTKVKSEPAPEPELKKAGAEKISFALQP